MAGGPSHLETLRLQAEARRDGRPADAGVVHQGPADRAAAGAAAQAASGRSAPFKQVRQVAARRSASSSRTSAAIADDICIVRSMQTEAINHDPAHTFMNTGTTISGRPSMGSWLTYGLGSESDNLPGFVVLTSPGPRRAEPADRRRGSGTAAFCRAGSRACSSAARAIRCSTSAVPAGVDARPAARRRRRRRRSSTACDEQRRRRSGNRHAHQPVRDGVPHADERAGADGLAERAASTCSTCTARRARDGSFAANCLLARRLAERGVRFIQLYHRDWDHHGDVEERHHAATAEEVDQAAAGADHRPRSSAACSTTRWSSGAASSAARRWPRATAAIITSRASRMWLAGGGIKGGITHGATDELGYNAVEDVVPVHDLHATMLHLLGIDHKTADVPLPGPRFPPDRCVGERGGEDPGLIAKARPCE